MSKFEWIELETLSNELAHLQSRLDAARVTKNMGLVQLLERDIADAAKRRAQVLADITNGLGVGSSARRKPQLVAVPVHAPLQTPVEQPQPAAEVEPIPSPVIEVSSNVLASSVDKAEGDVSVWDRLTPADVQRVKRGLATRRSEMLARHAEELKALETEQAEIDAIENAIAAFTQKFNSPKLLK